MNPTQQSIQMLKSNNVQFQQSQSSQFNQIYSQQQQYVNELIEQIESMDKQLKVATQQLNSKKKQLYELLQVTHNQQPTITYPSPIIIQHQQNPLPKTTQLPLVPLKEKGETTNFNNENKHPTCNPPLTHKSSQMSEQKNINGKTTLTSMPPSVIEFMNTNFH
ncbi:hypothetical protein QTN25_007638 [Entamoeba marina]